MNALQTPLRLFLLLLFFVPGSLTFSQENTYILNGSAKRNSCNCYTLTPDLNTQNGSVWNQGKIDLRKPFDFNFDVFLGCTDYYGADGIVFILQQNSYSVGSSGEGMGFSGVTPSLGIALDTYTNPQENDPIFDHISIQKNGNSNHLFDLAPAVPISSKSDNVEDCQWHVLRISWDPVSMNIKAYFDNVFRVQATVDLVNSIFNGDPMAYWGFSGGTGGAKNLQLFCTALNPQFTSGFASNGACPGQTFNFSDQSISFAPINSYVWDFGDGSSSTAMNPVHTFNQPGNYNIHLKIKALDGCEQDTSTTIVIGSIPGNNFTISDACFKNIPVLKTQGIDFGVKYQWSLDGAGQDTALLHLINHLPVGSYALQLTESSLYGCGPDHTAEANFEIKPLPQINYDLYQLCNAVEVQLHQVDQATSINLWNMNDGSGTLWQQQHIQYVYKNDGEYFLQFWAKATNGCSSDTLLKTIQVIRPKVNAGNDTVAVRNIPIQLHATGNGSLQWMPPFGLDNAISSDPKAKLSADQTYFVQVTTAEGCKAVDTIKIKVYDGPTAYVPNAFTPNGDGLNDKLKPVYAGIQKLDYFRIFDRWGKMVFSTTDIYDGWDGNFKGKLAANGTYVWMIRLVTYEGKTQLLKGTVTIIR